MEAGEHPICLLPDDLLLLIVQRVPELGGIGYTRGCWAACAAVASRLRTLVNANRSELRCVAG